VEYKSENEPAANIATVSLEEQGWVMGPDAILTYTVGAGRAPQLVFSFGQDFSQIEVVRSTIRCRALL
jgi:hypothetical protein